MRISPTDPLAALAKPARIEPKAELAKALKAAQAMVGPNLRLGVWLPYPPSGNRYWRHVGSQVVVSKEAREYRKKVAQTLAGAQPLDGDVGVAVLVHRPSRRGDLDNTLKVLLDSVRGFAYRDDSQIVSIHAQRFDGVREPGVRLIVKPAAGFGL